MQKRRLLIIMKSKPLNIYLTVIAMLVPAERRDAMLMLIVILIMALLEVAGVASIMPFMALLADPQLVEKNVYLRQVSEYLGVSSSRDFLFYVGLATFCVLVASLLFKALAIFIQQRFSLLLEYQISSRLVKGYLYQEYTWFLGRNSADLGKTILSEVGTVVGSGVLPLITLVTNSVSVALLILMLFLVDSQTASIVSGVCVLSYGLIYLLLRGFLGNLGAQRVVANKRRFEAVGEAFGAVKEIKASSLEGMYVERFKAPALVFAKHRSIARVVALLPRYALEAMAFGGLLIVVLSLLGRGEAIHTTLPLLTLYAFAGYRLMPAVQQIYASLTSLNFASAAIKELYEELRILPKLPFESIGGVAMDFKNSLVFSNVSYKYPTADKLAVEDLNFLIPAHSFFGFVGTTGGGKTTIIDLILGLLEPTKGTLLVDGITITPDNRRQWQQIIGYVPQQIFLADASILANIAFGLEPKEIDTQLAERVAKIACLHDFVVNETSNGYQTRVGEGGVRLSGGQRQRIGIARALYRRPSVLVLDEATSALDNITERHVMEAIRRLDGPITLVVIAHRLNTVRSCDHIAFVKNGKLMEVGSYNGLIKTNDEFRLLADAAMRRSEADGD